MDNIKVSVIIPVYNVEKYLRQCLDSVINQTLKDIEIICVNDGSTDNSLKILEEYASKDNRIKIINKENGGLSSARNAGLAASEGKYIHFLDSDDYIDSKCYEKLYNKIVKFDADFCQFGFNYVNNDGKILNKTDFDEFYKNKSRVVFNCFDERQFPFRKTWGAPLRLYNKQFFIDNVREFPVGKWYEDLSTGIKGAILAKKIVCLEEHLYFYRSTPNSIMKKTSSDKKCLDILEAIKDTENILNEANLFSEFEDWFFATAFNRVSIFYYEKIKDKEIKKEFKRRAKEYFKKFDVKNIVKKYGRLYKFCPGFVHLCFRRFLLGIFSIKNHHNNIHKVITIFGLKLKIRRKQK